MKAASPVTFYHHHQKHSHQRTWLTFFSTSPSDIFSIYFNCSVHCVLACTHVEQSIIDSKKKNLRVLNCFSLNKNQFERKNIFINSLLPRQERKGKNWIFFACILCKFVSFKGSFRMQKWLKRAEKACLRLRPILEHLIDRLAIVIFFSSLTQHSLCFLFFPLFCPASRDCNYEIHLFFFLSLASPESLRGEERKRERKGTKERAQNAILKCNDAVLFRALLKCSFFSFLNRLGVFQHTPRAGSPVLKNMFSRDFRL